MNNNDLRNILDQFEKQSGLLEVDHEIKERADGDYLIINIGNNNERFYKAIKSIQSDLSFANNYFIDRIIVKNKSGRNWLNTPEAKLFQRTLSESLTVDRYTLEKDFHHKYVESITGTEDSLISRGNHVVFGRRGSGKSSLLLYVKHKLDQTKKLNVWISMQTYDKNKENNVFLHVIKEVLEQLSEFSTNSLEFDDLNNDIKFLEKQDSITDKQVNNLIPKIKRIIHNIINYQNQDSLYIFLDDFHVVDMNYQPKLLSYIYAFSRGNRVFLKISAIEIFSKLYDSNKRLGLELGNDVQRVTLDYNLTMLQKAKTHIESIFEAYANYSGLPSFKSLCSGSGFNTRLVWVSAGVPRDAINIFLQAMIKSREQGQKFVSVTNINIAVSETLNDKKRALAIDSSENTQELLSLLEKIKDFCLKDVKSNAFLVQIKDNNPTYEGINKLIDLRFIHIINKSITPDRAGESYIAAILDFGFYLGVRKSQSMKIFKEEIKASPSFKELRKLPKFKY